jgi:hypothetical protein
MTTTLPSVLPALWTIRAGGDANTTLENEIKDLLEKVLIGKGHKDTDYSGTTAAQRLAYIEKYTDYNATIVSKRKPTKTTRGIFDNTTFELNGREEVVDFFNRDEYFFFEEEECEMEYEVNVVLGHLTKLGRQNLHNLIAVDSF